MNISTITLAELLAFPALTAEAEQAIFAATAKVTESALVTRDDHFDALTSILAVEKI